MPYTLNINAYPLQLYTVVENVLLTQERAIINVGSRREVDKLRKQIYGLKKALMASVEHPLKDKAIKLTTEQGEDYLVLKHVDNDVHPNLIAAAKQIEDKL